MRDHAELVKALRCFNANYDSNKLTNDAADAIEEQSKRADELGEELTSAMELVHKRNEKIEKLQSDLVTIRNQLPHWISVEERLPEKDEMVIVYYSWIGQSGTEYKEVSLATLEEMRYCGNKLLGWMPLPEAPKEGTE